MRDPTRRELFFVLCIVLLGTYVSLFDAEGNMYTSEDPVFLLIPQSFCILLVLYAIYDPTSVLRFLTYMMAKAVMAERDSDGDGELSKEEYDIMVELTKSDGNWPGDVDADALFAKYDSGGEGKLDLSETQALISEIVPRMVGLDSPNAEQEDSAGQGSTTRGSDQKEQEKLEKLYQNGYISEERYKRLTEDLERR